MVLAAFHPNRSDTAAELWSPNYDAPPTPVDSGSNNMSYSASSKTFKIKLAVGQLEPVAHFRMEGVRRLQMFASMAADCSFSFQTL